MIRDVPTFQRFLAVYAALSEGGGRGDALRALCTSDKLAAREPDESSSAFGFSIAQQAAWVRPGTQSLLQLYGKEETKERFNALRASWHPKRLQALLRRSPGHEAWRERGVLSQETLPEGARAWLAGASIELNEPVSYLGGIRVAKEGRIVWIRVCSDDRPVGMNTWIPPAPDTSRWEVHATSGVRTYDNDSERMAVEDRLLFDTLSHREQESFREGRLHHDVLSIAIRVSALPSEERLELVPMRVEVTVHAGDTLPLVRGRTIFRERFGDQWRITRLVTPEERPHVPLPLRTILQREERSQVICSLLLAFPTSARRKFGTLLGMTARLVFEDGTALQREWKFPTP